MPKKSQINEYSESVQACGLDSLVDYYYVKTYDIWEGNVTTRRGILIKHICFLGFHDIRKGVTLGRSRCTCQVIWLL